MKSLITRKIGMTTTIGQDGQAVAVTLLSADDNVITQVKTVESDNYSAYQIGTGEKKVSKPEKGHFDKAKVAPAVVKEFRIDELEDLKVGDKLTGEVFSIGDKVSVTGLSKGKGFAGTIKRHNFHRGRKTHGGRSYRRVGSIGSMYPQKIFKGKKMAGQLGNEQVTVRNLQIAIVDPEMKLIGVIGAVPGPRKGVVVVRGEG